METLGNSIQQNSAKKYNCILCNYTTDRKCNYNSHIISMRHVTNGNIGNQTQQKISNINYSCEKCNKAFLNRSGLWKHKKTCNHNTETEKKICEIDKDELIMQLLKQNADLIKGQQDMMIKLTENGINNNNTNSNNKNNN
jgi:hypothetical protein